MAFGVFFAAAAVLKGAFPLLVTPWTEKAELDVPVLVKEAEYVERQGVGGIIWPTAGEVAALDATGEYARGLEALAVRATRAGDPFKARLTAICPGKTSAEAVARVARVEALARRTGAAMAILARPPDDATNQTQIAAHYEAVARATTLPVIIQTYNGKSPQPSLEVLSKLAKAHPEVFGWVKEESPGEQVNDRIAALARMPELHAVFSGWGAKGLLYQGSRLGARGVITQRPAYAGLLARVLALQAEGREASDPELAATYAKYLYMINLGDVFCKGGADTMRGPHLYALERLGIFRNRLTRSGGPGAFKVTDYPMSDAMKAEVDARLAYALGLPRPGAWRPIGPRKARVVHWGIIHNHSRGKWDAVRKLTNDFELVGWVDDTASRAMRMCEPNRAVYTNYPCFTPREVFERVKPDLIVIETANSDLVDVASEIARRGIPMHMDKPLGTEAEGFRRISELCERRGVPLQIGYMFRANEAINKMVALARAGVVGEVYSVEADLDHNYGYPKYPEYATHYPGGTAYLLTCHMIEWAMPIFDDALPLRTRSIFKPAPGDPAWAKTHALTILEYPRANVVMRVCSRGTQPCRHIRIDGSEGTMALEPVEDFRKTKHTSGLDGRNLSRVERLTVRLTLRRPNAAARAAGYREGENLIHFKAPDDRYAGQLAELARILRGEIPNPPGLYEHDRRVHKVSLDATRECP